MSDTGCGAEKQWPTDASRASGWLGKGVDQPVPMLRIRLTLAWKAVNGCQTPVLCSA